MNPKTYMKKPYSLDERVKIKSLIDQGLSCTDIALAMGRTVHGINGEFKRRGGCLSLYDPFYEVCNGRRRSPYTFEDRKLLFECIQKGMKQYEIAKVLKRTVASLAFEISKYGGMFGYDPMQAQTGDMSTRIPIKRKDLLTRIENLEMQLEIIATTIQEILNGQNNKL